MIHGSTSSAWKAVTGMSKKAYISDYDVIHDCASFLKIDLKRDEMAEFAMEKSINEDSLYAIRELFLYLQEKKKKGIVEMLLRLSRLPVKEPKTFQNFEFSRFHGRQADELINIQTLSALDARKNLALIGPQGVGKTHLAMAFGYECCQRGYKTYFLKATEMNQKFTEARKTGTVARIVSSMVKPTCLIIDEIGYCNFDRENTRIFFDIVDKRYSKDVPNTMIVTSNTEPDKWNMFFDDDAALKCAMDRFFDQALVISMRGRSYRGRQRRKIDVIVGPTDGHDIR